MGFNKKSNNSSMTETLASLEKYKNTHEKPGKERRSQRLASIIQKDLGVLLPRVLERHGENLDGVFLSRLRVSDNGHHCFLFLDGPLVEAKRKMIKDLLPELRQEFCKMAQMRFTPTFSVDLDKEALYERKVTDLIQSLSREGWEEDTTETEDSQNSQERENNNL